MIDNNTGVWTFNYIYIRERRSVGSFEGGGRVWRVSPPPTRRGGCLLCWLTEQNDKRVARTVHCWGPNNRELLAYQQQNSIHRPIPQTRYAHRVVHVFIRPYRSRMSTWFPFFRTTRLLQKSVWRNERFNRTSPCVILTPLSLWQLTHVRFFFCFKWRQRDITNRFVWTRDCAVILYRNKYVRWSISHRVGE